MNYLPYRDGESKTEPMNQLEKEMKDAMWTARCNAVRAFSTADYAKIGAEVALKWIEKALSDAFNQAHYSQLHLDVVKRMEYNEWALNWLKEKGLKTPEV